MDFWENKVAVVTGASSGIGAAVCKDLCKWNITLVGMARRLDRLNQLKDEILALNKDAKFHPIQCDLTKEEDIVNGFAEVIDKFGGVDILINNAGVVANKPILADGGEEMIDKIVQTNLIAVVSCTKKAYKSMVDRDAYGYIINVSSITGHYVPLTPNAGLNVYPSTKYGITALNDVLRQELNFFKRNKIRISNISPGAVKTEIWKNTALNEIPFLFPEDLSQAICYMLRTPPRVQIQDIIIRPTGETF